MLALAAYTLSLLVYQPALVPPGPVGSCYPSVIGLDTSCVNNSAGAYLGEAIGQTFTATSTLIRRITVWRVAYQANYQTGVHLFILNTDSLGAPDVRPRLLDGPVVTALGDGEHPVRIDFLFDPPFQLPGPGIYCIALQASPCSGIWDLVADSDGHYPDGSFWGFSRSDCFLRDFPQNYPGADLIFEVEFCDMVTPTRGTTWGELKVHYR